MVLNLCSVFINKARVNNHSDITSVYTTAFLKDDSSLQ